MHLKLWFEGPLWVEGGTLGATPEAKPRDRQPFSLLSAPAGPATRAVFPLATATRRRDDGCLPESQQAKGSRRRSRSMKFGEAASSAARAPVTPKTRRVTPVTPQNDQEENATQAELGRSLERQDGLCHAAVALPSFRQLVSLVDDRNQLLWVPFSARDHSSIDLAVSPVHFEFPRRRRLVGRTGAYRSRTKRSDAGSIISGP